jgi:hypothetical protein
MTKRMTPVRNARPRIVPVIRTGSGRSENEFCISYITENVGKNFDGFTLDIY